MMLSPEELQRAVELLVAEAVDGGHIVADPAPVLAVGISAFGVPTATVRATLAGDLHVVPVAAIAGPEER